MAGRHLERHLKWRSSDADATDGKLAGRIVLITGGRRVGSDLARMLADRGAHVAMTFHTSRAAIEQTIAQVEASGGQGLAIAADLTQPGQAESAVEQVVNRFGRLDALVNMASVYQAHAAGHALGCRKSTR